jgi:excisionase family DNA binding protein
LIRTQLLSGASLITFSVMIGGPLLSRRMTVRSTGSNMSSIVAEGVVSRVLITGWIYTLTKKGSDMGENAISERHLLDSEERLWTVVEAGEFLGLGKTAVYALVSRREIPFIRISTKLRFLPEQMRAWAKKASQKV